MKFLQKSNYIQHTQFSDTLEMPEAAQTNEENVHCFTSVVYVSEMYNQ